MLHDLQKLNKKRNIQNTAPQKDPNKRRGAVLNDPLQKIKKNLSLENINKSC
jgi:hypothetical protein